MVGPECSRKFNEGTFDLVMELTNGEGLGNTPFEYRGLTFYPLPHGSKNYPVSYDVEVFVTNYKGIAVMVEFIEDEVYMVYDETDEFEIFDQKEFDAYLDVMVFRTKTADEVDVDWEKYE